MTEIKISDRTQLDADEGKHVGLHAKKQAFGTVIDPPDTTIGNL